MPEAISGAAAALSAVTALFAVVIAVRAEKRSRAVAAAQIYLELRSRFLEIYTKMGDLGRPSENDEERAARYAYWHHCFDEWYISTRLAPQEFRSLWKSFYRSVQQSGLSHKELEQSLGELQRERTMGFGMYAQDFVTELNIEDPRRRSGAGPHAYAPGSRPRADNRQNEGPP